MKIATLQVMIITVVSKLLGFSRELVMSYVFGASSTTDAYLVSQTVPAVIFSLLSAGVATGFIPMYSRIRNENGRERADEFTSNVSNALLLVAFVFVFGVLLLTGPIVKLFASGFSGRTFELAVGLTRISVFGICFTGLTNVFTGYLRWYGNFWIPAAIGLPLNLVIIGSLVLSAKTNVYTLAAGSVVATAAQLLLCCPFVRKVGYDHKLVLRLKDDRLIEMALIVLPVVIGTAVNDINVLVDRTLASTIVVGGISALNYANQVIGFVRGLVVSSVTMVLYPMISKMAVEGSMESFKAHVREAFTMVNVLVIPATVGAMAFSQEIVSLLFGRGAFTMEATRLTGNALWYYSVGMTALGLRDVLNTAFFALQDTKTPMISASLAVMTNIVLNIILAKYLGIGGLALATSISSLVGAVLMFTSLRRKIGPFGLKEVGKSSAKIAIASLLMGLVAKGNHALLGVFINENLALVLSIGVGILTYGTLICFARIPEVDRTMIAVKKRLGLTPRPTTARKRSTE